MRAMWQGEVIPKGEHPAPNSRGDRCLHRWLVAGELDIRHHWALFSWVDVRHLRSAAAIV